MGLNHQAIVKVTGAHAAIINSRLISWEHIDASGYQSDQLTLKVSTEGLDGLPKEGASIGLEVGLTEQGLVDKGTFKITRVTPRLFPPTVTIVATAAPFTVNDDTAFKMRKSKTFEGTTLGDIVKEVAESHGLAPRCDIELAAIKIEHLDQTNETDISFLTRISRKHDAVVKPVNKLLVLAKRGQVKTITGKEIPQITFRVPNDGQTRADSVTNADIDFPSRVNFKGVVAKYWDILAGEELEVKVGDSPFKKLSEQFDSELRAHSAATAELKKIGRVGARVKLDVPGNPYLVAEGIVILDDSFPSYMAGEWSVDRVISRGAGMVGYSCTVEATLPV